MVLLSEGVRVDGSVGSEILESFTLRLRALSPTMPILIGCEGDLSESEAAGVCSGANARVSRPANAVLADRSRWEESGDATRDLQRVVEGWTRLMTRAPSLGTSGRTTADLARLKQVSSRLHDPSARGEVLNLVLDFAADTFSRVVIFMVREDHAVGMAEIGFSSSEDAPRALEGSELRLDDVPWFKEAISTREALRTSRDFEQNHSLVELLGTGQAPAEAFVAPIESGGQVAALLYGDCFPATDPMGDTSALEVVLHQAGLALERALLERALADQ
jgi:hypothetical protein